MSTSLIDTRKEHLDFKHPKLIDSIIDVMKVAKKPLFFFHDDADGICSFLQFYHYMKEGNGVCVKSKCCVDMRFTSMVDKNNPDYIFVLDVAQMDSEFIDYVKAKKIKIVWIDHHEFHDITDFIYYNPKMDVPEINYPASYVCFQIVNRILAKEFPNYKKTSLYKKLLWIATVGTVSDWFVPDFISEFREHFPKIVDRDTANPPELIFDTPLSKLITFFNFALKGSTNQVNNNIKSIIPLKDPAEIFLANDKYIKKVIKNIRPFVAAYDDIFNKFKTELDVFEGKLFFSDYVGEISLTSAVSNELLYRYPGKIIIIARDTGDQLKGSLRSGKEPVREILLSVLEHVTGYGGGHEVACGFCINADERDKFEELFRKEFKAKYG